MGSANSCSDAQREAQGLRHAGDDLPAHLLFDRAASSNNTSSNSVNNTKKSTQNNISNSSINSSSANDTNDIDDDINILTDPSTSSSNANEANASINPPPSPTILNIDDTVNEPELNSNEINENNLNDIDNAESQRFKNWKEAIKSVINVQHLTDDVDEEFAQKIEQMMDEELKQKREREKEQKQIEDDTDELDVLHIYMILMMS